MSRPRIGLLFGGRSAEHEISLRSARSVFAHLDPERFEVVPIAITAEGQWWTAPDFEALLGEGGIVTAGARRVLLAPDPTVGGLLYLDSPGGLTSGDVLKVDVLLPILHGPMGEDGTLQGLMELAGIAYVGNGVLGSAAGMDKVIMKHLFAQAGLDMTPWQHVLHRDVEADPEGVMDRAIEALGLPIYVKPANMGSSVGVTRAEDRATLRAALALAGRYDRKILLETSVDAREIELAVIGNDTPTVSLPGEILSETEVYSFEAKYESSISSDVIPAPLPPDITTALQKAALTAYKAIDGAGLARMDFFVERRTHRVLINEVNTLPGFTSISMYPKLWEASNLPYGRMLERLIALAQERHTEKGSLSVQRIKEA